jgi:phosphohistidine phosphatase
MRHAKSDWDADYGRDHDRPLNPRGERSARVMGRLLSAIELIPDLAITSSALRASTTVRLAADAGSWETEIEVEPGLYGTGPGAVLEVATRAPNVDRLMLVGHQPTWSMVVHHLTGAAADMKTASVAVVDLMIDDWSEILDVTGVLNSLYHPRHFFGSQWDDLGGSDT